MFDKGLMELVSQLIEAVERQDRDGAEALIRAGMEQHPGATLPNGLSWEKALANLETALPRAAAVKADRVAAAVQATETEQLHAAARRPGRTRGIKTFRFASTGEAYDASQVRDDIRDGDILSVPSEGVVGILVGAWPVAVTVETGKFGRNANPDWEINDRDYSASVAKARPVVERMRAAQWYTPGAETAPETAPAPETETVPDVTPETETVPETAGRPTIPASPDGRPVVLITHSAALGTKMWNNGGQDNVLVGQICGEAYQRGTLNAHGLKWRTSFGFGGNRCIHRSRNGGPDMPIIEEAVRALSEHFHVVTDLTDTHLPPNISKAERARRGLRTPVAAPARPVSAPAPVAQTVQTAPDPAPAPESTPETVAQTAPVNELAELTNAQVVGRLLSGDASMVAEAIRRMDATPAPSVAPVPAPEQTVQAVPAPSVAPVPAPKATPAPVPAPETAEDAETGPRAPHEWRFTVDAGASIRPVVKGLRSVLTRQVVLTAPKADPVDLHVYVNRGARTLTVRAGRPDNGTLVPLSADVLARINTLTAQQVATVEPLKYATV